VAFFGVIPGRSISAFEGDGDCGVADSDWVGKVGADFLNGTVDSVNGELSAKSVVD